MVTDYIFKLYSYDLDSTKEEGPRVLMSLRVDFGPMA